MSISFDEQGLKVGAAVLRWGDVQAIATYKLDCVVHDDIRLAFRTAGGTWVDASEEVPGFADLMAEVGRRFAIPSDWYFTVMQPPFATNYRVLWRRGEPNAGQAEPDDLRAARGPRPIWGQWLGRMLPACRGRGGMDRRK